MKKFFSILACLLICGYVLAGCTDTSSSVSVSKTLEHNLNTLNKVVTKLDSVENEYIANPDFLPVGRIIESGAIAVAAVPPRRSTGQQGEKVFVERSIANDENSYLTTPPQRPLNEENIAEEEAFIDYSLTEEQRSLPPRNTTEFRRDLKPQPFLEDEELTAYSGNNLNQISSDNISCADGSCTYNTNTGCTTSQDNAGNSLTTYPNGSCQVIDSNGNNSSYICNGESYSVTCNRQNSTCTDLQVSDDEGNTLNYIYDNNGNCTSITCNEGCSTAKKQELESVVEDNLLVDFKDVLINNLYNKLLNNLLNSNQNPLNSSMGGLLQNINQVTNDENTDLSSSFLNSDDSTSGTTNTTDKIVNDLDETTGYRNRNFALRSLTYNPRYISATSNAQSDNQVDRYIAKVQKMYAMSSDVLEANSVLANCKTNLLSCINEVKEINAQIMNGTVEPNNAQLEALNNYIYDMKNTIQRIKNCNGELNNEIKLMTSTDNPFTSNGIDVTSSNYLRILNHLDARITYLKSAIATLEQVKYLIEEAQTLADEEVIEETINESQTLEEIIEDNSDAFDKTDTANNDLLSDNSINELDKTAIDKIEKTLNDTTDNVDDKTTDVIDGSVVDDNTNSNTSSHTTDTTTVENTTTESTATTETTTNNNATTPDDTVLTNDEYDNDESDSFNNVDTYLNKINNLDTYGNNDDNNDYNNTDIIDNDKNNIPDDTNNTNSVNNTNLTNSGDMDNLSSNSVNNNNDDSLYNNGVMNNGAMNNSSGYGIGYGNNIDEQYGVNAPNGRFQNGIITQNNLNNGVNNGVNGMNTGSGTGNSLYNERGLNRTTKNIDTYGYNTKIDMLNRGTVNNGINTLNITEPITETSANQDRLLLDDVKDERTYSAELLDDENFRNEELEIDQNKNEEINNENEENNLNHPEEEIVDNIITDSKPQMINVITNEEIDETLLKLEEKEGADIEFLSSENIYEEESFNDEEEINYAMNEEDVDIADEEEIDTVISEEDTDVTDEEEYISSTINY